MIFTLPAVIVQPITGAFMVNYAGIDSTAPWLVATYLLYVLAGLCWLPVVWLQIQMKRMLERKVEGGEFDGQRFARLQRTWFMLGWPAFLGLVAIFWLMVTKPS